VEGFLAAVHLHAEQGILAAVHRLAQRFGRIGQQLGEVQPDQGAAFVEQVPRGDVRVGDPADRIGQHQRHRRVLHHRVQQQLALHQVLALLAQGVPQRVVHADQLAQLVAPVDRDREGEIAVAITGHRALQRAQQPAHRRHHPAGQPE